MTTPLGMSYTTHLTGERQGMRDVGSPLPVLMLLNKVLVSDALGGYAYKRVQYITEIRFIRVSRCICEKNILQIATKYKQLAYSIAYISFVLLTYSQRWRIIRVAIEI